MEDKKGFMSASGRPGRVRSCAHCSDCTGGTHCTLYPIVGCWGTS